MGDDDIGCREQSASSESVLEHDDNGDQCDGTIQSSHHELPTTTPSSLQHAAVVRGGKIRHLLHKGLHRITDPYTPRVRK